MKYLFDATWDYDRRCGINHEIYRRKYHTWEAGRVSVYCLPEIEFSKDEVTYTALGIEEDMESSVPSGLSSKIFTLEEMQGNGYELVIQEEEQQE